MNQRIVLDEAADELIEAEKWYEGQPRCEQLVRLRFLHRREVQIAEQPPFVEVPDEQGIRNLPEKVFGRLMSSHVFPPRLPW